LIFKEVKKMIKERDEDRDYSWEELYELYGCSPRYDED